MNLFSKRNHVLLRELTVTDFKLPVVYLEVQHPFGLVFWTISNLTGVAPSIRQRAINAEEWRFVIYVTIINK